MKKRIKKDKLVLILTIIYCILICFIILFKMALALTELDRIRGINLTPFYYEIETSYHIVEVMLNVIIFIPLGIYYKLMDYSFKRSVIYGFVYSLILELSQFILKIGITDITDIITNTLGVIFGYGIYLLLFKIVNNKDNLNIIFKIYATIGTIIFVILILFGIVVNL